jgi:hypothetical protein
MSIAERKLSQISIQKPSKNLKIATKATTKEIAVMNLAEESTM